VTYQKGLSLCWSLDFNVNPMCSVLAQIEEDPLYTDTTVLLNYFQRWETTVYQAFSGNSGFFDLNSIWQKAAPEDQRPAPPQNGG
jgi:hypothetical protein